MLKVLPSSRLYPAGETDGARTMWLARMTLAATARPTCWARSVPTNVSRRNPPAESVGVAEDELEPEDEGDADAFALLFELHRLAATTTFAATGKSMTSSLSSSSLSLSAVKLSCGTMVGGARLLLPCGAPAPPGIACHRPRTHTRACAHGTRLYA